MLPAFAREYAVEDVRPGAFCAWYEPDRLSVRALWADFLSGRLVVARDERRDGSWYTLFRPGSGDGMSAFDRAVLERLLAGDPLKSIALDRQMTCSTLCRQIEAGLGRLGVESRLAFARIGMALASFGGRGPVGSTSCVPFPSGPGLVALALTPNPERMQRLSPSVRATVELLVDGMSGSQIALERGVSARTVANQLGAAYRRFRVSGRLDITRTIFDGGGVALARIDEERFESLAVGARDARLYAHETGVSGWYERRDSAPSARSI
jgi:DNA-binding CsgD family transcriptional regulator